MLMIYPSENLLKFQITNDLLLQGRIEEVLSIIVPRISVFERIILKFRFYKMYQFIFI